MQHFPFCRNFRFCLSSAYTVRAYIWRKWVLMSLQTAKCHMIVQMTRSVGGRGAERRRWQWRRTWIFRSNSTALPPWDVNCPFPSHLTKEGMIRLTADQLYYQHFLSPKPKAVYFKIDGLWPNTTATGLLARDREYFWIRLQPSFRVACQRGGAYGWKRCVVEWSIPGTF